MDLVNVALYEFGVLFLMVGSILGIIYMPMILGARWLPQIDDRGFFLLPVVWAVTIFAGVIIGGSLIAFNLDPLFFTVDSVFQKNGPWDLSYSEFLMGRVNPFNYSFDSVLEYLYYYDSDKNLSVLFILTSGCVGILILRAILTWGSIGAFRGIIFGFLVIIWSAYMTIFLVSLLFWLLNILNFWILAILTVGIHLYRNHALPFNYQTLAAPVTGGGHEHHREHGGDHH